MDESRFRVANVHHIYPRTPSGFACLCGAVMGTHRECTEHIVDMYQAGLRARVVALDGITFGRSADAWIRREEVLALLNGSDQ